MAWAQQRDHGGKRRLHGECTNKLWWFTRNQIITIIATSRKFIATLRVAAMIARLFSSRLPQTVKQFRVLSLRPMCVPPVRNFHSGRNAREDIMKFRLFAILGLLVGTAAVVTPVHAAGYVGLVHSDNNGDNSNQSGAIRA